MLNNKDEYIFVDTNALMYMFDSNYMNQSTIKNNNKCIDKNKLKNYLSGSNKEIYICSESYFEYMCHCYKHDKKSEFIIFYNRINKYCKEELGVEL